MENMPKRKSWRSPLKQKALLLLAAGLILGFNRSPKQHLYILKSVAKEWRAINRRNLYRIINEFKNERLVDYQEQSNGTIRIVLTEEGHHKVLEFDIENLSLKKPAHWDGKWRVVLFDIPEKKRGTRDALRDKLKELGFYEWQKSVFIFPYPCRDEIDFIIEFFEIRPFVRYAELSSPTNEAELKLHFAIS